MAWYWHSSGLGTRMQGQYKIGRSEEFTAGVARRYAGWREHALEEIFGELSHGDSIEFRQGQENVAGHGNIKSVELKMQIFEKAAKKSGLEVNRLPNRIVATKK